MRPINPGVRQCADNALTGSYNIGPDSGSCITTADLADLFCAEWGSGQVWESVGGKDTPREMNCLKLDSSKVSVVLGWHPVWNAQW